MAEKPDLNTAQPRSPADQMDTKVALAKTLAKISTTKGEHPDLLGALIEESSQKKTHEREQQKRAILSKEAAGVLERSFPPGTKADKWSTKDYRMARLSSECVRGGERSMGGFYCEHSAYVVQKYAYGKEASICRNAENEPLAGFLHLSARKEFAEEKYASLASPMSACLRGYYDEASLKVPSGKPVNILVYGFGDYEGHTNPTGKLAGDANAINRMMMQTFGSRVLTPGGNSHTAKGPLNLHEYRIKDPLTGKERTLVVGAAVLPVKDETVNEPGTNSLQSILKSHSWHAVIGMGLDPYTPSRPHRVETVISDTNFTGSKNQKSKERGQYFTNLSLAKALVYGDRMSKPTPAFALLSTLEDPIVKEELGLLPRHIAEITRLRQQIFNPEEPDYADAGLITNARNVDILNDFKHALAFLEVLTKDQGLEPAKLAARMEIYETMKQFQEKFRADIVHVGAVELATLLFAEDSATEAPADAIELLEGLLTSNGVRPPPEGAASPLQKKYEQFDAREFAGNLEILVNPETYFRSFSKTLPIAREQWKTFVKDYREYEIACQEEGERVFIRALNLPPDFTPAELREFLRKVTDPELLLPPKEARHEQNRTDPKVHSLYRSLLLEQAKIALVLPGAMRTGFQKDGADVAAWAQEFYGYITFRAVYEAKILERPGYMTGLALYLGIAANEAVEETFELLKWEGKPTKPTQKFFEMGKKAYETAFIRGTFPTAIRRGLFKAWIEMAGNKLSHEDWIRMSGGAPGGQRWTLQRESGSTKMYYRTMTMEQYRLMSKKFVEFAKVVERTPKFFAKLFEIESPTTICILWIYANSAPDKQKALQQFAAFMLMSKGCNKLVDCFEGLVEAERSATLAEFAAKFKNPIYAKQPPEVDVKDFLKKYRMKREVFDKVFAESKGNPNELMRLLGTHGEDAKLLRWSSNSKIKEAYVRWKKYNNYRGSPTAAFNKFFVTIALSVLFTKQIDDTINWVNDQVPDSELTERMFTMAGGLVMTNTFGEWAKAGLEVSGWDYMAIDPATQFHDVMSRSMFASSVDHGPEAPGSLMEEAGRGLRGIKEALVDMDVSEEYWYTLEDWNKRVKFAVEVALREGNPVLAALWEMQLIDTPEKVERFKERMCANMFIDVLQLKQTEDLLDTEYKIHANNLEHLREKPEELDAALAALSKRELNGIEIATADDGTGTGYERNDRVFRYLRDGTLGWGKSAIKFAKSVRDSIVPIPGLTSDKPPDEAMASKYGDKRFDHVKKFYEGLPESDKRKKAWKEYSVRAEAIAKYVSIYRHVGWYQRSQWIGNLEDLSIGSGLSIGTPTVDETEVKSDAKKEEKQVPDLVRRGYVANMMFWHNRHRLSEPEYLKEVLGDRLPGKITREQIAGYTVQAVTLEGDFGFIGNMLADTQKLGGAIWSDAGTMLNALTTGKLKGGYKLPGLNRNVDSLRDRRNHYQVMMTAQAAARLLPKEEYDEAMKTVFNTAFERSTATPEELYQMQVRLQEAITNHQLKSVEKLKGTSISVNELGGQFKPGATAYVQGANVREGAERDGRHADHLRRMADFLLGSRYETSVVHRETPARQADIHFFSGNIEAAWVIRSHSVFCHSSDRKRWTIELNSAQQSSHYERQYHKTNYMVTSLSRGGHSKMSYEEWAERYPAIAAQLEPEFARRQAERKKEETALTAEKKRIWEENEEKRRADMLRPRYLPGGFRWISEGNQPTDKREYHLRSGDSIVKCWYQPHKDLYDLTLQERNATAVARRGTYTGSRQTELDNEVRMPNQENAVVFQLEDVSSGRNTPRLSLENVFDYKDKLTEGQRGVVREALCTPIIADPATSLQRLVKLFPHQMKFKPRTYYMMPLINEPWREKEPADSYVCRDVMTDRLWGLYVRAAGPENKKKFLTALWDKLFEATWMDKYMRGEVGKDRVFLNENVTDSIVSYFEENASEFGLVGATIKPDLAYHGMRVGGIPVKTVLYEDIGSEKAWEDYKDVLRMHDAILSCKQYEYWQYAKDPLPVRGDLRGTSEGGLLHEIGEQLKRSKSSKGMGLSLDIGISLGDFEEYMDGRSSIGEYDLSPDRNGEEHLLKRRFDHFKKTRDEYVKVLASIEAHNKQVEELNKK